jgi:hypothetical protein
MLYRAVREDSLTVVYGFVSRPCRVVNGEIKTYYFNEIKSFPHVEVKDLWDLNEVIVLADTINASTGKYDKTRKQLVFEGDIIKADCDCLFIVKDGEYIPSNMLDNGSCGNVGFYVEPYNDNGDKKDIYRKDLLFWLNRSTVVSNVHDCETWHNCKYCEHFDYVYLTCPYKDFVIPESEICDEYESHRCIFI